MQASFSFNNMRFLKNRHLMSCSLCFIIALYIFARMGTATRIALTASAAVLLTAFAISLRSPSHAKWQGLFLSVCLLLATAVGSYTFSFRTDTLRENIGHSLTLTVTVTDVKSSLPYMSEFYVKWDGYGALLTTEYPLDAEVGDTLHGEFQVEDFKESINGYPEKDHQFSQGNIVHLHSYEDTLLTESGSTTLYNLFYNARKGVTGRFSSLLSPDSAAYLSCLLMGERDGLPAEIKSDFTDLGISHLLAISGMHLGILIGGLLAMLRLFRLHKSARNIISIIAIFLFAALTGFPSSLTRAGVATAVILACHFLRKRPDGATALCFAVAVIYTADPYSAFDTGLTLSFMAALGIVTVTPLLQKKTASLQVPRFIKVILEGAFVTVIALTFTLPFTLYYFGTFTFASLFTTLLFAPLVCAALYTAPAVLIFGGVPFLGTALCFFAEKLSALTFTCTSALSAALPFTVSAAYPFAKFLAITFCAGFILLLLTAPRRPWLYLLPICIFTVSLYSGVAVYDKLNEDKVFFSVNETKRNDTLCFTCRGKTTIIDISGATSAPSQTALYTAKTEQYAVHIENYILVNRTYRTATFTEKLLNSNRINHLYLPSELFEEDEYDSILKAAKERGTEVHSFSFCDTLELGDISITPNRPEYIKRSSMPIHNILIQTEKDSLFFAGAAYSESSLDLPEADYIIAGSYGPLYKENFSFGENNAIISETARDFYTGDGTVYEKVTNVILNND